MLEVRSEGGGGKSSYPPSDSPPSSRGGGGRVWAFVLLAPFLPQPLSWSPERKEDEVTSPLWIGILPLHFPPSSHSRIYMEVVIIPITKEETKGQER